MAEVDGKKCRRIVGVYVVIKTAPHRDDDRNEIAIDRPDAAIVPNIGKTNEAKSVLKIETRGAQGRNLNSPNSETTLTTITGMPTAALISKRVIQGAAHRSLIFTRRSNSL